MSCSLCIKPAKYNCLVWCARLFDFPVQVTETLSLIHTLCSSLQHVLSLLSLLSLHLSLLGNGFKRRMFQFLWVPELLPCLSYQLLTVTAHNRTAVPWLNPLIQQSTLHFPTLHCTNSNCPAYMSALTAQKHLSSVAVQLLLSWPRRKNRFPISSLVHIRNLLLSNEFV
jgi:hypothetical protein